MAKKIVKKRKFWHVFGRAVIFLVLLVLAISFLYPLYYMLINSLKSLSGYYVNPFGLPNEQLQWQNFATMISQFKILKLFGNSFIVSFFTVLGLVVMGTLASFSFAKVDFKGKDGIYLAILATLFVPAQVTMIPMYISFAKVGLVDNYLGVIIAYWAMFLPETIMLMTANFKSIPNELLEAATIDGCGYFGRIRNVVMPMGWPAISLSIIFFFICSWNDLFTPMVLLKSMDKRTVMVALSSLIGRYTGDPPFQYAGLLMSAIPALAVYAIFQKSIVKGMSMGAIK
ncbi:L-arabinose transport system permease protein AraQ [bioreactor metagenome]|uniref:L-arabinose transport system permease protein AraQ n=1 Tax=bioreactor metagenome TaxID=1076179 RepID=A0A644YTW0_9ZZZZ